jgi:hypothetical protein
LIQQPLFPFNSHGKTGRKQARGARSAGQDILAEARVDFELLAASEPFILGADDLTFVYAVTT